MKAMPILLSFTLAVVLSKAAPSEVTITPNSPTSSDTLTIEVSNQYASEATIVNETIDQEGDTFLINIDVVLACSLPNAPILTSEFSVGPLPAGDYQVLAVIEHTSQLPGCGGYTVNQGVPFTVNPILGLPCEDSGQTLCLQDDRFEVKVVWRDYQDNIGEGQVVPGSSPDSGMFYFFNPNNWEMLVKVLDGCSLNDHHWVFAAATTDVEYTLTVRDTFTGASSVYTNELGVASPAITDTGAFASCP